MTQEDRRRWRPATECIHAGDTIDPATGAVNMPIHPSSTYARPAVGESHGYVYSRLSNPTRDALERCVAELEGGARCLAFASGMAATACALELLEPGNHVIAAQGLYGGSYRLFDAVLRRSAGLDFSYVDVTEPANVEAALRPETRMLWLESVANPLLHVSDLPVLADLAHARDILVVVDNTFATPMGQQPLALGADIVMHSATKYLGGHSDTLAGLLVTGDRDLARDLSRIRNNTGAVLGAFDSYLVLRGIKTLALRMERHQHNALAVARWCEGHAGIERTWYPGLESHPSHAVATRLLKNTGGVVSLEMGGGQSAAHRFMNALELFLVAESLGGVESLVGHPATMSHSGMAAEDRARMGIKDSLVRLSVGVEDVADIIADLEQALGAV
jgi:cystathionine gamma-lyase